MMSPRKGRYEMLDVSELTDTERSTGFVQGYL